MNTIAWLFRPRLVRRASLALLCLVGGLPGRAQEAGRETLTVALSAPTKPGSLEVKLVNGYIHVTGYDGRDVVIEAGTHARPSGRPGNPSPDKGPPNGLKRIATGGSLSLTAEEKNNHVELTTNSLWHPVYLTIKVPYHFSLRLGTVNNGDIRVENVVGELEVSNVIGSIHLNQVSGSAVANTVNGNLIATFRSVTAGAPMAFSTFNGKVDITFPRDANATLKMQSEQGSIYSDFDVAVDNRPPEVTRSAEQGVYRLGSDGWTYGTINKGGPEILLKTINGNIFLRKAK